MNAIEDGVGQAGGKITVESGIDGDSWNRPASPEIPECAKNTKPGGDAERGEKNPTIEDNGSYTLNAVEDAP